MKKTPLSMQAQLLVVGRIWPSAECWLSSELCHNTTAAFHLYEVLKASLPDRQVSHDAVYAV
jgi:hypothetical protein